MIDSNNELRQIVMSLARSAQAITDDHEERIKFLEETQRQLVQTQQSIANLLASLDNDRPTMLRKLTAIENKIDRLLDQS